MLSPAMIRYKMTKYMACFKGKSLRTSLSRQELKLRVARCSGDPKKIVEVLSQFLGVEVATTWIPHVKGEEIFGSTKQKLDLLPGDDDNFHGPNKVNFSQP